MAFFLSATSGMLFSKHFEEF